MLTPIPRYEFAITIEGVTLRQVFVCPYWELLPPLSPEERSELLEDIKTRGVVTPVIAIPDHEADAFRVLDGFHRVSLAHEAGLGGVPYSTPGDTAYPKTPEQEEELAIVLNAKRRQLTPEVRQKLVLRLKRLQKSNRQIADALGVSEGTVRNDLNELRSSTAQNYAVEIPSTIVGKDGKERLATQPKKESPDTRLPCERCHTFYEDRDLVEYEGADYCAACFDLVDQERSTEPLPSSQNSKSEIEQSVDAALAKAPPLSIPPQEKADGKEWRANQEASRVARHETIAAETKAAQQPGQLGPFSVLYIDPPWQYNTGAALGSDRNVNNHYATLSLGELKALDINAIAAKNCVLYLWVTAPLAGEAFELLSAWGFTYKSQAVWIKEGAPGMGHWWRVDHELLYVAVKGNFPTPPLGARFSSVIKEKKGAHSEKPDKVRELLDRMYPSHAKAELFARKQAKGWACIGNEIDGKDIRELLRKGVDPRQQALPQVATPQKKEDPQQEKEYSECDGCKKGTSTELLIRTESGALLCFACKKKDLVKCHLCGDVTPADSDQEGWVENLETNICTCPACDKKIRSTKQKPKKEKVTAKEEVTCITCKKKTTTEKARLLNLKTVCGECFTEYPPSTLFDIELYKEPEKPFSLFGQTFSAPTYKYSGLTWAEVEALMQEDSGLTVWKSSGVKSPEKNWETSGYYLALINGAKTEEELDDIDNQRGAYLGPDTKVSKALESKKEAIKKKTKKCATCGHEKTVAPALRTARINKKWVPCPDCVPAGLAKKDTKKAKAK